jgi:hypothetical protein
MLMKRCNSDALRGLVAATALLVLPCVASAQDKAASSQQGVPALIEQVGGWFGRQAESMQSVFQGAGHEVKNFGREAGMVAERTADSAKDAADTVATIPNTRMIGGHQECGIAPNGAPDCVAAAEALCRSNGFKSGTSVAMTSAVKCPAEVYLAGRSEGPQCKDITFVSRALCR